MLDPERARAGEWSARWAVLDDTMALLTLRDLGVFDALQDGPLDIPALAVRVQAAPRRLRAFLDVVVDLGFLRRDGARYGLDPRDEALLAGPARLLLPTETAAVAFGRRAQALDVLRHDVGLDVASAGGEVSERERREFLRYLDQHARAEAAEVAEVLAETAVTRAADLGCGAATYTRALLARWPRATAVLVDRGNAAGIVAEATAEIAARVRFVAADLLGADWVPAVLGSDLILLSNMLHNVGPDDAAALIWRAANALAPGGRLVVKDFFLRDDGTGPPGALRFALQMAMTSSGGDLYSCAQLTGWMRAAGLRVDAPERLLSAPESFVLVGWR